MNEDLQTARKGGRNMTIFGVMTMALGMLALSAPLVVGGSVVMLIGFLVVVGGMARFFWGFKREGSERVFLLIVGGLTTLAGVLMIANPLFTAALLSILLAVYFIVDGICEIIGAVKVRPEPGWLWLLFAGVISLFLGIMIWKQVPLSGPVAIGVLIGIKLLFSGLTMMTVGQVVRSATRSAEG